MYAHRSGPVVEGSMILLTHLHLHLINLDEDEDDDEINLMES